nr:hypothetical protein Iba_chr03aCG14870 [Ipomoea batatas]
MLEFSKQQTYLPTPSKINSTCEFGSVLKYRENRKIAIIDDFVPIFVVPRFDSELEAKADELLYHTNYYRSDSCWVYTAENPYKESRMWRAAVSTSLRNSGLDLVVLTRERATFLSLLCVSPTATSIETFPRMPWMGLG